MHTPAFGFLKSASSIPKYSFNSLFMWKYLPLNCNGVRRCKSEKPLPKKTLPDFHPIFITAFLPMTQEKKTSRNFKRYFKLRNEQTLTKSKSE
jgi:hypothetical protein